MSVKIIIIGSTGKLGTKLLNYTSKNQFRPNYFVDIKNEISESKDYIKNFLRKFTLYKKMKEFEKKFLRRKK